jgi:hypothetical protein
VAWSLPPKQPAAELEGARRHQLGGPAGTVDAEAEQEESKQLTVTLKEAERFQRPAFRGPKKSAPVPLRPIPTSGPSVGGVRRARQSFRTRQYPSTRLGKSSSVLESGTVGLAQRAYVAVAVCNSGARSDLSSGARRLCWG